MTLVIMSVALQLSYEQKCMPVLRQDDLQAVKIKFVVHNDLIFPSA